MKAKYILTLGMLVTFTLGGAQTMCWIPSDQVADHGLCQFTPDKKGRPQCYILEYRPAVTGVLTSYTTGFLVSCTSRGSAVTENQSCSMTPNNRVVDGCGSVGYLLLNSSGNTGTIAHNQIEAGKPVILHQVCFSIPDGESITIEEDPVTDLTTSVDLGSNQYVTEFPGFEKTVIRSKYDVASLPSPWLDFQGIPFGHLVTQLDWSSPENVVATGTLIERSSDGIMFMTIGEAHADDHSGPVWINQFFDHQAMPGANYYRLKQAKDNGTPVYSPVRVVRFDTGDLTVTVSPNPANDKLFIRLGQVVTGGKCILMDALGIQRIRLDFDPGRQELQMEVRHLEEGSYTLLITAGEATYTERIAIVH